MLIFVEEGKPGEKPSWHRKEPYTKQTQLTNSSRHINKIIVVICACNYNKFSTQLDHQKNLNIETAAQLREDVKSLWKKLEIPDKETKQFSARWLGYNTPSAINAVRNIKIDFVVQNVKM